MHYVILRQPTEVSTTLNYVIYGKCEPGFVLIFKTSCWAHSNLTVETEKEVNIDIVQLCAKSR